MPERSNYKLIAGVDEAGRGPLAGPVIAAAVILPPRHRIQGLADSKQLTALQRNRLYDLIINKCIAYGVGSTEVAEIDSLNIHHATLLAMRRAIETLSPAPDMVWIDGIFTPKLSIPSKAIPFGDQTIPVISAASIIAKVTRDRIMEGYESLYPGYGLAQHKGYGTSQHCLALQQKGPTPIHRRSFSRVAAAYANSQSIDLGMNDGAVAGGRS